MSLKCYKNWLYWHILNTEHTLNTDVYYTLAAKKPDSLIMGLENTIEQ